MPITLTEYVAAWLPAVRVHPRTKKVYGYALEGLFRAAPTLARQNIEHVRRRDIRAALLKLLESGRQPNMVRNAHTALSSCLATAVDEELLVENPARGAARRLFRAVEEPGIVRSLTRPQLARFLDAAEIVAPGHRDVFLVLAFAGLRIGEALGLQPDDVDVERRRLRVARQWVTGMLDAPKFARVRTVDVSADLAERLGRRIAAVPGLTFLFQSPYRRMPQPLDTKTVQDAMRRARLAARLPPCTPHFLRHTYACMLLEETGDLVYVQRQLGHRSIQITADVYGRGARPQHHDALDRLAGLHRPPHRVESPSTRFRQPA